MRQGIWRALLVLGLLVPLSRLSFGDTFAVSGFFENLVGESWGNMSLPSCDTYGGGPWDWEEHGTVGSDQTARIGGQVWGGSGWSFDGFNGPLIHLTINTSLFSFTVEDGGTTGIPVTWSGELDLLSDDETTLFEIAMSGVGTASIVGVGYLAGSADLTGVGQVVYEDPSVPEPSTLTLMGIAGIASIVARRFRRSTATQN
jgi:hypothetical protein